MTDTTAAGLAPVVKTIEVAAPIELAFRVFTDEIATWWPTASHSIREDRVLEIVLEGRPGGRIYEVSSDGEADWGRVLAWDPPHRFVLEWDPSLVRRTPTEVEVTFEALDEGRTRLRLEHRGWDRIGERGPASRAGYENGWDSVLASYEDRVGRD
jgi:uncharacterized protein YndB with AHSA1/START domain